MFKIECEGCQHNGGNAEHCFFWGLPVSTISDQECGYAKCRHGSANYLRTKKEIDRAREIVHNKA